MCSMSQKQRFHHFNKKPTPPKGGWSPAYTNLNNPHFKYLVGPLREGCILPTDESAEVYNKNPYLWPVNPYKFTRFFERAITLMSTLSDDKSTLLLSLSSLDSQINPSTQSSIPDTTFNNPSTQSSIPDTTFGNNREQPPESEHEFAQSQPTIPTSPKSEHEFAQSQPATPTSAVCWNPKRWVRT